MSERTDRIASACLAEAKREYSASVYSFDHSPTLFLLHLDRAIALLSDVRSVLEAESQPQKEQQP